LPAPATLTILPPMLRPAVLAVSLLAAALALAAEAFVPGTEDLPLMPGLAAVAGTEIVFDKPEGRIVEAQAAGKVSRGAVQKFYGETLPGLGWTAAGPQKWRREAETLAIDIKGRDGGVTVGFTLTPRKTGE
jgi:hypothetical protein